MKQAKMKFKSPTVTITLPLDVAATLRAVHYVVAGPPSGPRGAFDTLDAALAAAGVQLRPRAVVFEKMGNRSDHSGWLDWVNP